MTGGYLFLDCGNLDCGTNNNTGVANGIVEQLENCDYTKTLLFLYNIRYGSTTKIAPIPVTYIQKRSASFFLRSIIGDFSISITVDFQNNITVTKTDLR